MKLTSLIVLLSALAILAQGQQFKAKSFEVTTATYDNFLELTKVDDYIVFFYNPSCQYCQNIYGEVEKLADLIQDYNKNVAIPQNKTELKLAHINGIENKDLIYRIDVEKYPSFIFFHSGIYQFYHEKSSRQAQDLLAFYTTNYYTILPEIPGLKRHYLTKVAVWEFYTKVINQYKTFPEVFWAAGAILALGILLHPCLYRKNPFKQD